MTEIGAMLLFCLNVYSRCFNERELSFLRSMQGAYTKNNKLTEKQIQWLKKYYEFAIRDSESDRGGEYDMNHPLDFGDN